MKALSLLVQKLWPRLNLKVNNYSRYHVKGLVTRNIHLQYENPISSDKKVMAKVKVFQK